MPKTRVVICIPEKPPKVDDVTLTTTNVKLILGTQRYVSYHRAQVILGFKSIFGIYGNDWIINVDPPPANYKDFLLGVKGPFIITELNFNNLRCYQITQIFNRFEEWDKIVKSRS